MPVEIFDQFKIFGYEPTRTGYFQRVLERAQTVRPEIQCLVAMMSLIELQEAA